MMLLPVLAFALPMAMTFTFSRRYWRDEWRRRDIHLTPSWGCEYVFASGYVAVAAVLADWQAAVSLGVLAWMLAFAARADILIGKIPKEPMWAAGIVAAAVSFPYSNLVAFLALTVTVAVIVALLVLITRGGLGSSDARLILAATPAAFTTGYAASIMALGVAAVTQIALRLVKAVPTVGAGHAFAPALAIGLLLTWLLSLTPLWAELSLNI